jgi:purine-nucleoside phosphorylase
VNLSPHSAPIPDVIERVTGRKDFKAAVVLGSGLSALATSLVGGDGIPYAEVEGMPQSTVEGHEGSLFFGDIGRNPVLVFAGRVHLYEGRTTREVTYPVRAAIGAGCDAIVLTNAAGGIREGLDVGAPCLIADHLNLTGQSPLTGPNDDAVGPRFLDLTDVYDPNLRELAHSIDPDLKEGVYAGLPGPTYETPAEVKMLRTLGADLVGMSTVIEAIAARYLRARVLGISVVTNLAAGISPTPLSHDEVAMAGMLATERLGRLLHRLLADL